MKERSMKSIKSTPAFSLFRWAVVIPGLAVAALLCAPSSLVAQLGQESTLTCIEDAVGESLQCTANDTRLGLLIVADPNATCMPVEGEPGQYEATVNMQARLESTAAQRYDLNMFIAEDGGNARTGSCHINYLPNEPNALSPGGTCSISGDACLKDEDCDAGESCVGGYDPGAATFGEGTGPFWDREENGDTCGDLEQGVLTFYDLLRLGSCSVNTDVDCAFDRQCPDYDTGETCDSDGTPEEPYEYAEVTIRCVDLVNDAGELIPDGKVDVSTCVSWDNNQTNDTPDDICENVYDGLPGTGSKCNCSRTNTTLNMPAFLTLVKTVVNDNGGTAVADDFQARIDGNNVPWGVAQVLEPGSYTASELGVAGYTASDWGGDCAADGTITLAAGEDATCTITNDDNAPSLILAKTVVNDNGGTAEASDWTLFADAFSVAGSVGGIEVTDQAGTYGLDESGPTGYALTSLTCDNSIGQVSSVTVGLGETVTCTFVNDDLEPSLRLAKTVVNDNGGTAIASDWILYADALSVTGSVGGTEVTDQAGTYDLSESTVANYTNTSITCDDNPEVEVTSVTFDLGETVTCTFVNDDDAPSLRLAKTVVNDNGGTAVASDWILYADALSVTGSVGGTEVTDQAGTYDLSESSVADYTNTSITCDDDPGTEVTSVTIDLGETITCTFVNDDDAPSLTLIKVVVNGSNPGGTAVAADWTLNANGTATPLSGSTPVASGADFLAGTYDLSESGPSDYDASDWVCVGDGNQTDADTIVLGIGDSATCTITNTAHGRVEVLKTVSTVPTAGYTFEIRTGVSDSAVGTTEASCTTDANGECDFGGATFSAGDYWFCETNMLPGWETELTGYPGAIVPNNTDPEVDNSTICAPFSIGVGETVMFTIDNTPPPGGDARTIGFWKNWTSCDGNGNQDAVLDDNLPIILGNLLVDNCPLAVDILDKRDHKNGRKKAGDAIYGLAAQLAAYELNQNASAGTCQAAVDAANDAQALLASVGYDGDGDYLKGKDKSAQPEATELAGILDDYNNNLLCSP
jgi:hypothetical protein